MRNKTQTASEPAISGHTAGVLHASDGNTVSESAAGGNTISEPGRNGYRSTSWDDLALPQNYDQLLPDKLVLTNIPLRKPRKWEWVRTHSEWEQKFLTLKLDGERDDLWILAPGIVPLVSSDLVKGMVFVPTITRQGTVMMWPLRLPSTERKQDEWARTALSIAREARTTWVQVHSNLGAGCYDYRKLPGTAADPAWPKDFDWDRMRELAFRERLIDSETHPILQAVLGLGTA